MTPQQFTEYLDREIARFRPYAAPKIPYQQGVFEAFEAVKRAFESIEQPDPHFPRWVKANERLPTCPQNCFVMVFTPLQGGYNYKSTRLWSGEAWIDELYAGTERDNVVEWLEEPLETPAAPSPVNKKS